MNLIVNQINYGLMKKDNFTYNYTHHDSINKKSINADYSAWTENFETNPKAPKFKDNEKVRITKYKSIFSKEKGNI